MFEIVFMLAATGIVFGLFFLVFFMKQKSGGNKIRTCAQCNCDRNKTGLPHKGQGGSIKGSGASLPRGDR